MALGQSHTVAENTDRSNKTTTSRIIYILLAFHCSLFIIHFLVSNTDQSSVPSRLNPCGQASEQAVRRDTRAHLTTVYFVYFERVYLLEGREANPNVHATPTRDRGSGGKKEKNLSSFFALLGYTYHVYIRACCPSTVTKRRGKRERSEKLRAEPAIRPTAGRYTRAEDEDSLDRSLVWIVARNAKGERNRKDRERGGALWTTL